MSNNPYTDPTQGHLTMDSDSSAMQTSGPVLQYGPVGQNPYTSEHGSSSGSSSMPTSKS